MSDANGIEYAKNVRKRLWGSSSPEVAEEYAGLNAALVQAEHGSGQYNMPQIAPIDYHFTNPMVAGSEKTSNWTSVPFEGHEFTTDELAKLAELRGHDGLIVKNVDDVTFGKMAGKPTTTYAALKPGTARSATTGETLFSNDGKAALTPQGIRAYHGSPHDFDRFDASKIGTGEGAQAFGHGLYFAENEGVAKSYKTALAKDRMLYGGVEFESGNPVHEAAGAIDQYGSRVNATSAFDKELAFLRAYQPTRADQIDKIKGIRDVLASGEHLNGISHEKSGHMYEVNINAHPDHFLDWDKPLADQPPKVRELAQRKYGDMPPHNGQSLMRWIENDAGADRGNIHNEMSQAGIPGIRYLDQGSRTAGQGSSNYVVFDPATIDILRKYANHPNAALPGAASPHDDGIDELLRRYGLK